MDQLRRSILARRRQLHPFVLRHVRRWLNTEFFEISWEPAKAPALASDLDRANHDVAEALTMRAVRSPCRTGRRECFKASDQSNVSNEDGQCKQVRDRFNPTWRFVMIHPEAFATCAQTEKGCPVHVDGQTVDRAPQLADGSNLVIVPCQGSNACRLMLLGKPQPHRT
jgi:hypothetical protein